MKQLLYFIGKNFIIFLLFFEINFYVFRIIYFTTRCGCIVLTYSDPKIIFGIALIALGISLFTGLLHYFRIRKIANGNQFDLSTIQSRTLFLPLPPKIILEQSALILENLPANILEKNTGANYLTARIHTNSWDDYVKIDVLPITDTSANVKITCRPSVKIALVDYGRNYEYVERLLSRLKKLESTS